MITNYETIDKQILDNPFCFPVQIYITLIVANRHLEWLADLLSGWRAGGNLQSAFNLTVHQRRDEILNITNLGRCRTLHQFYPATVLKTWRTYP